MKTNQLPRKLVLFAILSLVVFVVKAQVPTTAAPTPAAHTLGKVISIFSDAFTNIPNTNFAPNWGQTSVGTPVQIAGNNTLKYETLNYQGIEIGQDVNATPMTHLHIDVWTANETSLSISCISRASGEKVFKLTPLNLNAWNSYDIPLTAFTSLGLSLTDIFQFKLIGAGGNTIYVDNLYFYDNSTTVDTQVPTGFTATKGAVTFSSVELLLTATDNSGAVNYEVSYGSTTVVFHAGVSGLQKSCIVTGLNSSTDYSFSIKAKDLTGNVAANTIIVTASTIVGLNAPTVAAPTPTVAASKVMSIYSDAYTPVVSNINYNPNWSQTTLVTTFNAGTNATMKYENFNYQGIDFSSIAGTKVYIDITNMTKVHFDIFTPNETAISFQPISEVSGATVDLTKPIALNVWNSYDIPVSYFLGLGKTKVYQVMFKNGTGKLFYVDNIYFYNDALNAVADVKAENQVKCYPTSVTDKVVISSESQIQQVCIYNLLGKSVKLVTVNDVVKSIGLKDIPAGNYLVSVNLMDGSKVNKKIIKL